MLAEYDLSVCKHIHDEICISIELLLIVYDKWCSLIFMLKSVRKVVSFFLHSFLFTFDDLVIFLNYPMGYYFVCYYHTTIEKLNNDRWHCRNHIQVVKSGL